MTDSELPKTFDPAAVEARIYKRWVDGGYFGADPASVEAGGDPYVIVIPPPNVTAVLHMGHGLNNTVQDVLVRWRRMQGRVALWVPGTDHAGIATQNVVERLLASEGSSREDIGREAFVERVWEFVGGTGNQILEQLKAIGCSCDWDRTRFTFDEGLSRAVREVFVRLYESRLIYRGEYIINWCPRCLTALSNEEAEGSEADGSLWHIRYPLAPGAEDAAEKAREAGAKAIDQLPDGRWFLTVSTTRPETMLGDTGVAVSPKDPRYAGLVGASVELPLTGRLIPIVADEYVDADFGTGMVKVTPAHDPNDFGIAERTGLAVLDVMTPEASMNDAVPEAFRGLDRFEARKAVLKALEADDLLAGKDDHRHSVPRCYRCDTVVEPRLSEQWFVKMKPLAEPALAASKDGTISFTPDRWTKVYDGWMENIRDWCISRQLWWGHRIPVWYCDCGNVMVLREDPPVCTDCGATTIRQDEDVLDTWFSSWLWPMSVFGWPDETEDLEAFYPGHTLVTAPEILFFWVARMIMSGYQMKGEAPFTEVYLHGTVRDIQGRKMSKSLGNGIDPLEVVDLYGADALRFTLLSNVGVGADIRLDNEDIETAFSPGRNFVNKLWNAGRFALMSIGEGEVQPLDEVSGTLELEDRWILSRLDFAATRVTGELEALRIHGAAEVLRELFWNELADWYLEFTKARLRPEAEEVSRQTARAVLAHALDQVCRLLHPFVPFVT
ncbi:MAG: valine--tRNA ligase [Longimicrobiales bacterium]